MTRATSKYGDSTRRNIVMALLALVALVFVGKLLHLQVFQGEFLRSEGEKIALRMAEEDALRGMILDREGEPIAISTPVSSVVINPKRFWQELRGGYEKLSLDCATAHKNGEVLGARCAVVNDALLEEDLRWLHYQYQIMTPLAEQLDMPVDKLYADLLERRTRGFYYLKRQLPPAEVDNIIALNIDGIFREDGFKRFYPTGEILGQVVGFTGIDGKGQEGVEQEFDDWLAGQPGRLRYMQGEQRNAIALVEEEAPTAPGAPLQLSIDKRIQYITHQVLLDTMQAHRASSASAVMLDVTTGEVLAMVSLPAGNPNNVAERVYELRRNRTVTDIFEPGSTIKPMVMAAALETGVVNRHSTFATTGVFRVAGEPVKDTRNYGTLDSIGIMRKSSNIGMAMISQRLPRETFQQYMRAFGLGVETGIEFPDEARGILHNPHQLDEFSYATNTFGYGVSTTALQLAHAYATLANGGVEMPVTLLKRNRGVVGERVVSQKTAGIIKEMLVAVVSEGGTGTRGNTESYTVAGKSGTSHLVIEVKTSDGKKHSVYDKSRYRSLFAGFAPVNNPRIALVIMVEDPKAGDYYGGLVAAPAFAQITEWSLKMLGVLPDKIAKSNTIELTLNNEAVTEGTY